MMRRIAHHAGVRPCDPRRTRRNRQLVVTAATIAALLFPIMHRPAPRLVWNASQSVPTGLYRVAPGTHPRVGELAAIRPSPALARFMAMRGYVEQGVLLVKPIAAPAGARVCRRGTDVTIDGRHIATALERDRRGRALPRWQGCWRLGADQLFLIAPARPDSFDSRYFGAVARLRVVGRARPLWTWP